MYCHYSFNINSVVFQNVSPFNFETQPEIGYFKRKKFDISICQRNHTCKHVDRIDSIVKYEIAAELVFFFLIFDINKSSI